MGDGGKWVCGMSLYEAIPAEKPCIIYSFGVQFESSFGKLSAVESTIHDDATRGLFRGNAN